MTNPVAPRMSTMPSTIAARPAQQSPGAHGDAQRARPGTVPSPALRGGNRATRCQSRPGKLDLNYEKQNKSSQRRYGTNMVLKTIIKIPPNQYERDSAVGFLAVASMANESRSFLHRN